MRRKTGAAGCLLWIIKLNFRYHIGEAMQQVELKLKQASAVLGATPKDVQNLVQFRLVRPRRRNGVYWFDAHALLTANVVLYLKESLGASTASLRRVIQAAARVPGFITGTAETLSI